MNRYHREIYLPIVAPTLSNSRASFVCPKINVVAPNDDDAATCFGVCVAAWIMIPLSPNWDHSLFTPETISIHNH